MNGKVKVVYLTPTLTPSGFGRQVVELVTGLDKGRFDPVVVVMDREIHYREIFGVPGVRVVSLDRRGLRRLTFPLRLVRLLRGERPDILHGFQLGANKWARIAGAAAGIENIVTSVRNTNLKPKWILIERILYRLGKKVIVNSEAIGSELTARIPGIRSRLVVIHNGVDTERFRPAEPREAARARRRLGFGAEEFVIAHIGGASRRKNPLGLMDALRILYDSGRLKPGLRVLFVGATSKAEDEGRLRERIQTEPFGGICRRMGPVRDIESVYGGIDLLVLPSLWEGLPNVVVEAMACGKPVIVSKGANNCGVVADGENGWEFPTDDTDRLAGLIDGLSGASKSSLSEIGLRARGTILSGFSRDRMVEETTKIYDSMNVNGSDGGGGRRGIEKTA